MKRINVGICRQIKLLRQTHNIQIHGQVYGEQFLVTSVSSTDACRCFNAMGIEYSFQTLSRFEILTVITINNKTERKIV